MQMNVNFFLEWSRNWIESAQASIAVALSMEDAFVFENGNFFYCKNTRETFKRHPNPVS